MSIEVVRPGLLATLQDRGRVGHASLGVGRAGAFDDPALRLANALVGNPPDACALELALAGPTLRAQAATWIALTGAPMSITIDGTEAPGWAPVRVPAGARIVVGATRVGCRSYLAFRGGLDAAPLLGSRSTDLNASLGPLDGRPLRAGDVLPVGRAPGSPAAGARAWSLDPRPWFDRGPERTLALIPGLHLESLSAPSIDALFSERFRVSPESNRTGARLSGARLQWSHRVEMVSEGCVPGLLQLPPSGQPIAFGPECPVSGGYPRIGQIAAVDLPKLAQSRPGDALRFVRCTLDAAVHRLLRRERALRRLEAAIHKRLGLG